MSSDDNAFTPRHVMKVGTSRADKRYERAAPSSLSTSEAIAEFTRQLVASTSSTPSTEREREELRDYEAMSAIPAPFIDSWYLTTWEGHVRIAFGEALDKIYYRSAVVMALDDAEKFAGRLLRAVERRKKRDQEAQTKPDQKA